MTSSPSSPSTAVRSPSPASAWLVNRWVQGAAAGLLTLVPVRRYPEWLRQAVMWVPAAGVTAVLVTPRVWEAMAAAGARPPDEAEQEQGEPEPMTEQQSHEGLKPPRTMRGTVALWSIGAAAGASVYGYMRFSLWADGAIEDKLHELGVARPRIVMAVLGGLLAAATGGAPEQQGPRVDTAQRQPRLAASA